MTGVDKTEIKYPAIPPLMPVCMSVRLYVCFPVLVSKSYPVSLSKSIETAFRLSIQLHFSSLSVCLSACVCPIGKNSFLTALKADE